MSKREFGQNWMLTLHSAAYRLQYPIHSVTLTTDTRNLAQCFRMRWKSLWNFPVCMRCVCRGNWKNTFGPSEKGKNAFVVRNGNLRVLGTHTALCNPVFITHCRESTAMTQEFTDELGRNVECHMAMTSQLTSLLLQFIFYCLVEFEARTHRQL